MHIATNRVVATWEPDGWPAGVITGYAQGDYFYIEHVICWRGRLSAMVRAALAEADRFEALTCALPHAFPLRDRLERLARRLGFVEYARDAEGVYLVRPR